MIMVSTVTTAERSNASQVKSAETSQSLISSFLLLRTQLNSLSRTKPYYQQPLTFCGTRAQTRCPSAFLQ